LPARKKRPDRIEASGRDASIDEGKTSAPPVLVHVELDERNAYFEEVRSSYRGRYMAPRSEYYVGHPLCAAPCGATVASDKVYRVTGPDIAPSDAFVLPRWTTARVSVTNRGDRTLRDVGGVLALVGGFTFGLGITGCASGSCSRPETEALLVTGLVSLAVGAPLWLANWTTVEAR
jgi:hypothetical protein